MTTALVRTDRLVLRPMGAGDVAAFHALVTRPEVARMLFVFPTDWPLSAAAAFVEDWRWKGTLRFRLAIEEGGIWRGWIGATDGPVPDVFYALTPEAQGRGLAREALTALCDFLFDRFDVPALTAGVFHDNPASMAVLRRIGFVETHVEDHASAGRVAPAACHMFRFDRPSPDPAQNPR